MSKRKINARLASSPEGDMLTIVLTAPDGEAISTQDTVDVLTQYAALLDEASSETTRQ